MSMHFIPWGIWSRQVLTLLFSYCLYILINLWFISLKSAFLKHHIHSCKLERKICENFYHCSCTLQQIYFCCLSAKSVHKSHLTKSRKFQCLSNEHRISKKLLINNLRNWHHLQVVLWRTACSIIAMVASKRIWCFLSGRKEAGQLQSALHSLSKVNVPPSMKLVIVGMLLQNVTEEMVNSLLSSDGKHQ